MTLNISELTQAESMTDLKADLSAKVRGGLFGIRVTKIKQETYNYNQNGEADNGSWLFQGINSNINVNVA